MEAVTVKSAQDIQIETLNNIVAPPVTRDIRAPYFESDDIIACEFWLPDGRILAAGINKSDGNGGVNPDWTEVLQKFSLEELNRNSAAMKERREQADTARKEQVQAESDRRESEYLLKLKLEALEVDAVKRSTDKDLKHKIRRAKSSIEVMAYAITIIQRDLASQSP